MAAKPDFLGSAIAKAVKVLQLPPFDVTQVMAEMKALPAEDKRDLAANPAMMQDAIKSYAAKHKIQGVSQWRDLYPLPNPPAPIFRKPHG